MNGVEYRVLSPEEVEAAGFVQGEDTPGGTNFRPSWPDGEPGRCIGVTLDGRIVTVLTGEMDETILTEDSLTLEELVVHFNDTYERGQNSKYTEAFGEHLQQASRTVATWPAWKRGVLGGALDTDPHVAEIAQLKQELAAAEARELKLHRKIMQLGQ